MQLQVTELQLLSSRPEVPEEVRAYTRQHHGVKNVFLTGKFIRFVELLPEGAYPDEKRLILSNASISHPQTNISAVDLFTAVPFGCGVGDAMRVASEEHLKVVRTVHDASLTYIHVQRALKEGYLSSADYAMVQQKRGGEDASTKLPRAFDLMDGVEMLTDVTWEQHLEQAVQASQSSKGFGFNKNSWDGRHYNTNIY